MVYPLLLYILIIDKNKGFINFFKGFINFFKGDNIMNIRKRKHICVCPICNRRHKISIHFTGYGIPRIYCKYCKKNIKNYSNNEPCNLNLNIGVL